MSVQQELDARAERLDKELQKILLLFLAGQISLLIARTMGNWAFNDALNDYMQYFKEKYDVPREYNEASRRIEKVLHEKKEDFINVLERRGEPEKQSERMLKHRAYLVALTFLYALNAQATIELGIITGAKWLEWRTMEDGRVCSICEGFKGLYDPLDPNLPEIPPHPSGRCWWVIHY